MRKNKKKSSIELMPIPALLQMLIMQVKICEQKQTKKHGRSVKNTTCEILKRSGYTKKESLPLAKKIIEQEQ